MQKNMRKTKIICTLGPSTDDPAVLRQMLEAGMNVARFNFSHGTHADHQARLDHLKALRQEMDLPVAALLDTKGPEIRLRQFENGKEKLVAGQTFTLTTREVPGTNEIVSITYKDLPQDVSAGATILLADGLISTVAALCAVRLCPGAAKAVFASHVSAEPAGRAVLDALGKKPLITAEMRLGEGTGAVASIPLWDMARAVYAESYSFAQCGVEAYTPQGGA